MMADRPGNVVRPGQGRRRFTIVDAMVLVAAAAGGMALMRLVYPSGSLPRSGDYIGWLLRGPSTCLASASATALVLLCLRRPRPRRRRLAIQPGFVACTASLVGLFLGLGSSLFFQAIHYTGPTVTHTYPIGIHWSWATGAAPDFVLGAWLGLWLSGRWAAEPSWIDCAGRALGLFWIAAAVWTLAGPVVQHFAPML